MKIITSYRKLLTLSILFVTQTLYADVAVMIHGYLSDSSTWENSAISQQLDYAGWKHAGTWVPTPAGHQLIGPRKVTSKHKSYTVNLPTLAPIAIQSRYLYPILMKIQARHSGEKLVLIGHSAGGVIARYTMVAHKMQSVKALITIASPHLGTAMAERALDATSIPFPFSMVSDFFGGPGYHTLKQSRGLYYDLIRPRPYTLLGWLNLQRHPDIKYYAIIRISSFMIGDYFVPTYSQDMNNIPALRGKSTTIPVATGHELRPGDGAVITSILKQL